MAQVGLSTGGWLESKERPWWLMLMLSPGSPASHYCPHCAGALASPPPTCTGTACASAGLCWRGCGGRPAHLRFIIASTCAGEQQAALSACAPSKGRRPRLRAPTGLLPFFAAAGVLFLGPGAFFFCAAIRSSYSHSGHGSGTLWRAGRRGREWMQSPARPQPHQAHAQLGLQPLHDVRLVLARVRARSGSKLQVPRRSKGGSGDQVHDQQLQLCEEQECRLQGCGRRAKSRFD